LSLNKKIYKSGKCQFPVGNACTTFVSTKLLNAMTFQFNSAILIFSIAITALFANIANAQENALKITPFQPLLGKFSIQYERVLSPQNTAVLEFQKWNERRQTGGGLFAFGIFVSSTDVTTTNGYRMQVLGRHYIGKAMNGGFLEGGGYFGKHDIEVRNETSSFNPWAIFGTDPLGFYQNEVHVDRYDNVKVAGLKLGGGWQKSQGVLTFECSAGLNFNAINSRNIRPTLSQKPVAPYGRIALGVKF
jgi:hypothetical protein